MKLVRFGICALVVFAVAAHGAVEDWARAALETGAGLLLVLWAVRFAYPRSHEEKPPAAAAQGEEQRREEKRSKENQAEEKQIVITPLLFPLAALALFSLAQIFFRGTVSAYSTRIELTLLLADIVLLFLAAQVFRTVEDWRTFVWFIMIFGFIVAIFGILQQLTFNGKLYWFREMRYGGIPFGPYVNRNHFAGFIELVIPISLVPLVLGKVRRERWFIVGIFALVPIGALFLCASRGGIISFAVQLGVLLLLILFRRSGSRHVLAGGAVLLLAFLLVYWLGVREILDRFSSLQALEVTVGKRASMRQDTWRIFLDHRWTGTGLGTLPIVFPAYETLYDAKIVNHAHNDYLEALADTGIVGGLCCAAFLVLLFGGSLRSLLFLDKSFSASLHLSGLLGCSSFLVHSLVDFNLHIPANALLFFLVAHLATGEIRYPSTQNRSVRRRRSSEIAD
jgi:O-antigen ligase